MTTGYVPSAEEVGAPTLPKRLELVITDSPGFVRLAALFAIAVTFERIWLSQSVPLWLDETWTAMIATRPDWASFWREAYLDVNAPFYYLIMKLWVGVAGTSNVMLRLPSLLCIYAAAALPLLWRAHGLDRKAALVWASLILLWWPGIIMSIDARTYGLLLLASTAGAIAFIQALRSPRSVNFLLWAAIGAVQVFSHYFAYFLVALQGIVLVGRWRLALIKRWYAFVPFAIPFVWTAYHLPRVLEYGKPGVAWYEPTNFQAALNYVVFTFGAPNSLFPTVLLLALGGALWKSNRELADLPVPVAQSVLGESAFAIRCAVLTGVCALVIVLVLGALKASLTARYLVPLVPTMLLGVVLMAHRTGRSDLAYSFLIIVYGLFALDAGSANEALESRSNYGYERASDFLEASRPRRLIFLWDHTNTAVLDEASLEGIGNFFFVRHDVPIETTALRLSRLDDPNVAIENAVKGDRVGVIWLYDAQRDSAAKLHPPRLADDPAWHCRDVRSYVYRKETKKKELGVGTIACARVTERNL